MILKIALFLFLSTVSAVEFGDGTGRVLGGSNVAAGRYPYNAAIHYKKLFLCSGAYIGTKFILTTAECVDPYSTGSALMDLSVKLDSINSGHESSVYEYSVFSVNIHPSYISRSERGSNNRDFAFHLFNIAVITLQTNVVSSVLAVGLPDPLGSPIGVGVTLTVIGWGKEHGIVNDLLQSADVLTIDVVDCIIKSGSDPNVGTNNNLCTDAFDPINGRPEAACTSDHGAPLISKSTSDVLQGLVSWASCEWENIGIKPTIYTSIFAHLPWIKGITGF